MANGHDWSRIEVEGCVADYLRMLKLELNGQRYSKTEHAEALLQKLNGRRRASLEFKHCNINAVMIELGYPYHVGVGALIKRVFGIDVSTCVHCGGAVGIVASTKEPNAIRAIHPQGVIHAARGHPCLAHFAMPRLDGPLARLPRRNTTGRGTIFRPATATSTCPTSWNAA